jgi:chemosensory pili system protein ChpA (sensor histidine kinase/response regulator)
MTQGTENSLNAADNISSDTLSAWKKANKNLIKTTTSIQKAADLSADSDQMTNFQHKLALLQNFKASQAADKTGSILVTGLTDKSSVDAYADAIIQLADQLAFDGYYDLQDACRLMADSLQQLGSDELPRIRAELVALLEGWPVSGTDAKYHDAMDTETNNDYSEPSTDSSDNEFTMDDTPLDQDASVATAKTTCADYIASIGVLADQLSVDGYFNLQSVSLLLIESLHELKASEFAALNNDLLLMLDNWSDLIRHYRHSPPDATPQIMKIVRHPDLKLPLYEQDFQEFEKLLTEEPAISIEADSLTETPPEPANHPLTLAAHIAKIEQLAELAAADGYFGLYDVSLIVAEALHQLPEADLATRLTLLPMLDNWSSLMTAYRQESPTAVLELLKILESPDLNLALNDEDMSTLKTLLTDDLSKKEFPDNETAATSPAEYYLKPDMVEAVEQTNADGASAEKTLEKTIAIIEQLANESANEGYFGLQDVSLILAEALQQNSNPDFSDEFLSLLDNWSQMITAYKCGLPTAIADILQVFNYPELNMALADEEIATLSALLADDIKNTEKPTTNAEVTESEPQPDAEQPSAKQQLEASIVIIEQLADQAGIESFFGLQDVSCILLEALNELLQQPQKPISEAFLSALDNWSTLISIYQQAPLAAAPNIIKILKSPELGLQLTDDDYSMLETMLEEGANSESQETAYTETVVEQDEVQQENAAVLPEDITEADRQDQTVLDAVLAEQKNAPVFQHQEDKPANNYQTLSENVAQDLEQDAVDTVTDAQDMPQLFGEIPTLDTEQPVDLFDEIVELEEEESETSALPLSRMAQELVELLQTEAGLLEYRFGAVSFAEPLDSVAEHLQLAEEELERLGNAAKMVGFEGLSEVCTHVCANISLFLQDINSFNLEKLELLKTWIVLVKDYLLIFSKPDAGCKILSHLSTSNWSLPLEPSQSASIQTLMKATSTALSDASGEEDSREKEVSEEDISLELPNDVNQELLDLLLQELPGYTRQFSEAVQKMQTNANLRDIDVAQRIAHTIKGSGNTVGIKGIAVLTHHLEDILMACAKEHEMPGAALVDTLINAADCLETMCDFLLGSGEPPEDTRTILQEVLDWANQIDKNGVKETNKKASTQTKKAKSDAPKAVAAVDTTTNKPPTPLTEPRPKAASAKEKKDETAESNQTAMVRVPTEQIENLFRLSSESIILNGQIYERHRRMKNQLQSMEAQFVLLQQLGSELEQLIDLKDLSGRTAGSVSKDFDALEMDQYNELHTASKRMVEAAVDASQMSIDIKKDLEHMHEILEYQQRLVIDTQEAIMQTRFVPVSSIAQRLQRGLRQTCRLTGKQGELELSGEELLIDGDTLGALVDPIMHLLRNAVDHGLENPEQRLAAGKPATGKIRIEFDREGNSIVVRCQDDGRGLDFAAIRNMAEKNGVIRAGEMVSEDELKRIILKPNFTTRLESTQTSGRGVGLDAVNHQVIAMSGVLTINSEQDKGLTVELRMPLPLSRSHALLANVGSYKVAISSKGLTQILFSGAGELQLLGNEQVLIIGDDIYPVKRLSDLLHVEDRRKKKRSHGAVLLVQDRDKITAVLVDYISDSRDVVIKNLGHYMRKIHGFIGATILGDGSVTPVLDIPELLRLPDSARGVSYNQTDQNPETSQQNGLPTVLVVEDSLSQRRALEQILVDAGFRVLTARDGIEAVELLSHVKLDIVLTDLEMPRMNGIELTSHIRAQSSTRNLPVIMVTSRSTEKHRLMSEEAGINYYLTKPVQDDDLLSKMQSLMDRNRVREEA